MSDQLELDRTLARFLASGTDELADRVIDAALAEIDRTPQRHPLGMALRFTTNSLRTRFAVAAVIGVLAVGLAVSLIDRAAPPVGAPSPTTAGSAGAAAPTPTVNPSPDVGPPAQTGPMGTGRQIHTATVLDDGRVLIAGGYDHNDGALVSAVLYDAANDTFSPTGFMADARGYHTATLLAGGRVLITGGGPPGWPGSLTGITGPFLASAELYDPRTGTFTSTGSMATAREGHTATLLTDGRVLITGGAEFQARSVASAELYDPRTGMFSPTGSMTTARAFHTATLLADGRVLIVGGSPAAWGTTLKLASAEVYDPKTGTFTLTGPMTGERDFHTATLLADGRVLVAGGSSTSQEDLASAEIYDPRIATFTATGRMVDGREYQAATLLSDGHVLVVGGGGDYANRLFLGSAELYDARAGTFVPTASLAVARTYQTVSLLGDGRVLVTGGYGAVAPLASAEIYDPVTGAFSPAGSGR
jgi:hypothetical protein